MEWINQKLIELKKRWDIVEVCDCSSIYGQWCCRDHTDEGIGGSLSFLADTPSEAVQHAYEYAVNERREKSYVGVYEIDYVSHNVD